MCVRALTSSHARRCAQVERAGGHNALRLRAVRCQQLPRRTSLGEAEETEAQPSRRSRVRVGFSPHSAASPVPLVACSPPPTRDYGTLVPWLSPFAPPVPLRNLSFLPRRLHRSCSHFSPVHPAPSLPCLFDPWSLDVSTCPLSYTSGILVASACTSRSSTTAQPVPLSSP